MRVLLRFSNNNRDFDMGRLAFFNNRDDSNLYTLSCCWSQSSGVVVSSDVKLEQIME